MRADSIGLFWEDLPPPKKIAPEKVKRTPPEKTWGGVDYLPDYEEAVKFSVSFYSDQEIYETQEPLAFDIECYPNYFLAGAMGINSGKIVMFESVNEFFHIDQKLKWILENKEIVTFNGLKYDIPILEIGMKTTNCNRYKAASDDIIKFGLQPNEIRKLYKTKRLKINHIDLLELVHLRASLKLCAGRLHAPKLQELPYDPDTKLTEEQIIVLRWYWYNDLIDTKLLYHDLESQIDLRRKMSGMYKLDLRSKSDAQIAEAILGQELGRNIIQPTIKPGTIYRYSTPDYLNYKTPLLRQILSIVQTAEFIVTEYGNIGLPEELKNLKIKIGNSIYRLGIGGLHSSETCQAVVSDDNYCIFDWDVISYYPRIIERLRLYPKHIGPDFLRIYSRIVARRVESKKAGRKIEADSLKITVNGSFGKFGSPYSILYNPDLVIQVTVTGQLSLLLLIEQLELNGISVVSANTDGVTVKCHKNQLNHAKQLVNSWELATGYATEQTPYTALYSRDINNYFAIKKNGEFKLKGIFSESGLQKNPFGEIVYETVRLHLRDKIDISDHIRSCKNLSKFLYVRTVKGGAVKNGEYLGKVVRWYKSCNNTGEIIYAKSGNKVPNSDNATPCQKLPKDFPQDVDYDYYIEEVHNLIEQIGCQK